MNLTLNQVYRKIEQLAQSHKQINSVRIGNPIDYLANGDLVYPALLVNVVRGTNSRSEKKNIYNFDFLFCDIENVAQNAKENQTELLSDLTSIANDFKQILSGVDYWYDWQVGENSSFEYLEEYFKDQVVCCKLSLEIGVWNDTGYCDMPIGVYTPPARVRSYGNAYANSYE